MHEHFDRLDLLCTLLFTVLKFSAQNPRGFLSYKIWKKRWFKLDEFSLQYFETEDEV